MTTSNRRALLVDLDGTLVDTNYLHTLAWSRALRDAGEWAPMNAIHHLIGVGSDQLAQRLLGRPAPRAAELRARRYRELIGEARAFPGAADALRRWHEGGFTVVIASSSPRDELDAMLKLLDADDAIDAVTSADDVDTSKPEPDVFHAALAASGAARRAAVVIGDSVWDVEAAHRAGIAVVAVESGGICAADLRAAGAAAVYHDVTEVAPSSLDLIVTTAAVASGDAAHLTDPEQAAINAEVDPPA